VYNRIHVLCIFHFKTAGGGGRLEPKKRHTCDIFLYQKYITKQNKL